jgi:hypothetical protein
MALKGNLRDFSFIQLLNLINLAKKTGTLIIDAPGQSARLAFRNGRLAYAIIGNEEIGLVDVLYQTQKITRGQYKAIRQRVTNMNDKEFGLRLVNANYLSQQEILASLQTHYTGIVKNMFAWVDGFFRFEKGIPPPGDKILLRINLENLIIEGVRQIREWEHLQDEIPSLDMALKFTERPKGNLRDLSLNAQEWKVISFVNPKNTIKQISKAVSLDDLDIRRIVFSLLQAGLIEMVHPDGKPAFSRPVATSLPQTTPEEQKSLINRLIARIRSI